MIGPLRQRPTLMFGLGATRAGTSWLNRYLTDHPDCHLREIKEAHYFDTLERGSYEFQLRLLTGRHAELSARRAASDNRRQRARLASNIAAHEELIALFEGRRPDHAAYMAYLARNAGRAKLVGEITPAYALVSEATLAEMRTLAPVVRFLYVLRDPVTRLWSNIRQTLPSRPGAGQAPEATALRMFDDWLAGGEKELALRCDYRGTLERLFRVVPESDRLVLIYETLFSDETLFRLCRFLGIRPRTADTETRVHAAEPMALDAERAQAARARLAPQYDFVHQLFGALPPGWDACAIEVK